MPSVVAELDRDRYREEVLRPARRLGDTPPADLLVRYAVPAAAERDPERFSAHVEAVLRQWRALHQRPGVFQPLAAAMLAAHADLVAAGSLSYAAFARRREQELAATAASLRSMAASLAAGTSLVTRSTVALLGAAAGGAAGGPAVEAALAEHGIAVVDAPVPLPPEPPDDRRSALAANLRILGLRLAAEAVFGPERVRAGFRILAGFELDTGERLTREVLDGVRQHTARRALDERKTALDNVLAALGSAASDPNLLFSLVFWQLADVLRPQVDAGMPQRAIAAAAAALGLADGEAAQVALALGRRVPDRDPVDLTAEGALAAGDFVLARRLAAGRPAADDLRGRIEEEAARFDALLAAADAARERGATEVEAELLSTVLESVGDGRADLRERLRALPAPAPRSVSATVREGQVHLEWRSGPARTGGLRYRVVRRCGTPARTPGAGTLVAETAELHATDPEPPPGRPLHYSVFAARYGDVWSFGTAAEPQLVLPEVQDVALHADHDSVLGSWRVPAGTAEVVVTAAAEPDRASAPGSAVDSTTGSANGSMAGSALDSTAGSANGSPAGSALDSTARSENGSMAGSAFAGVRGSAPGSGAGPEVPVAANLAGFLHTGVPSGVRQRYRIRTAFDDDDGRRRLSPGVTAWATVEPPPAAVTDLRARWSPGGAGGAARLVLTWTRPASGSVVVHRHVGPPPWPAGATVTLAELSHHGRPVPPGPADGRDTARITADHAPGRSWFTAVTVGRDRAVVGSSVSVTSAPAVERLRATRHEERVRVQWTWPDGVHLCRIAWEPGGGPAECSRRRYQDDGGFEVTVGPAPVTVSVRTVCHDAQGEVVSPPVEVDVPGQDVTIRYGFRRRAAWLPWGGSSRLVLSTETTCRIPPLVVVHRPGRTLPLRAESGTAILRLPELELTAGKAFSIQVPEPEGAGESRLGCFFAGRAPDGITLVRAGAGS